MTEIDKLDCQIGVLARITRCHRQLAQGYGPDSLLGTHHMVMAAQLLGEGEELMVERDILKAAVGKPDA